MIIDRTYFIGPLVIANLGQIEVQNAVDYYISLYEPELLSKCLGESLYNAFAVGLESETPEQRWTDLQDGVSFTTTASRPAKWVGFAPELLGGPIAAYVWFHYNRDISMQQAAIGTVIAQAENAVIGLPIVVHARVWNIMIDSLRVLWDYLRAKTDVYPEWKSSELDYCKFRKINQFGI